AGQQQRGGLGGQPHRPVRLDRLQVGTVEQLEQAGRAAVGADRRHRRTRRGGGVEHRHQRPRLIRRGPQRERDLRDDPQRALGADEQPGQVVARHPLGGAPAGPQHLPVGEHHLQPEHVLGGHAVLDAAHPAGVGGHVAADGRGLPRAGVGWEPQPVRGQRRRQGGVDDARLHHRHPVGRVDRDDPVHRGRGDHQRAVDRVGRPGQAGPGTLGHDRHPVGGRDPDRGGDVRGRAGPHHRHRGPGLDQVRLVPPVAGQQVRVGEHRAVGQRPSQVRYQRLVVHQRRLTPRPAPVGMVIGVTYPGQPAPPRARRWWRRSPLFWVSLRVIALGDAVPTGVWGLGVGGGASAVGRWASIVPVPVLVLACLGLGRYEPGPGSYLAFCFGWGAVVATAVAMGVNTGAAWLFDRLDWFWGLVAVVVAPVIEELGKAAAPLLLWWRRRAVTGITRGIVYCGLSATGFAMVENVLYLGGYGYRTGLEEYGRATGLQLVFIIFIARILMSGFAHPLF